MDNVIVIGFDEASKAYHALSELKRLNDEGRIELRGAAVVQRQLDGSIVTPDGVDNVLGLGTLAGSTLGALIGVLGGPVGVLVGWTAGTLGGATGDVLTAGAEEKVLTRMSAALPPGTTGVIAQAYEYADEVIDGAMAGLGGPAALVRRPLGDVEHEIGEADKAARDADRAAMRQEFDERRDAVKAEVQERVGAVKAKLEYRS